MNCLGSNHFVKQCKSIHRCKICQNPHHTLLHVERSQTITSAPVIVNSLPNVVSSHPATNSKTNSLLMTTRVVVHFPDGTSIQARVLLDNASSASFILEHLVQTLHLPSLGQPHSLTGHLFSHLLHSP